MYVCLSIILLHNMNKNPLRYECIARDLLLYVITIQVGMVPLNWLPYCGGKELLLRIV